MCEYTKGVAKTKILNNIGLVDGCAHTVCGAVIGCLNHHDLDVTKCMSLATDGASGMLEKNRCGCSA